MTKIELTEEQIATVLAESNTPSEALEAGKQLVGCREKELAANAAELERLKATDEHDEEFNDPKTKTDANPRGTFSPLSTTNRKQAVTRAAGDVAGSTIALAWAQRYVASFNR